MNILLSMLKKLPEYEALLQALDARQTVAVSGVSQIIRSHLIAALCAESGRPALIVCQDDMAARRAQAELAAFLGSEPPILPPELTFYESASVRASGSTAVCASTVLRQRSRSSPRWRR